jgi:hypothetical protein
MTSFELNGKKASRGDSQSGTTYHFESEAISAYSDDRSTISSQEDPYSRRWSTGPYMDDPEDKDVDMALNTGGRSTKRGHGSSSLPVNADTNENRESVRLLRFSVAISTLMMCLLVFTIITKDAEEENIHDPSMYLDHMSNPYSIEDGSNTRPASVPMGTYDYDSSNTNRDHNNDHEEEMDDYEGSISDHKDVESSVEAPETQNTQVPSPFDEALADINSFPPEKGQTPLYWHIPRSGGTTLETILSECLGLTLANQVGAHGHETDDTLEIVKFGAGVMGDMTFVNVDVSTPTGIDKAKNMGLVSSGFADVIVTPLVYNSLSLFDPSLRGRMFTVIRHPVERAVSEFNYLKTASWEPTYHPDFANMTLLEYANGPYIEGNWMVRSLSNLLQGGNIAADELDKAKTILQEKCLVGLTDSYKSTVHRVVDYFGWDISILRKSKDALDCQESLIANGLNGAVDQNKKQIEEGSEEWNMIMKRNELDMELFNFAEYLYREQQSLPAFGV